MLREWSGRGKDGSLDGWDPNNKVVISIAIINFATTKRRLEDRQSTTKEASKEKKEEE